ncbi:unnamed protein product [Coregonus sp. 'balchen']|nr:unnamed protein product [Coregonus sp. 'balchen']
MRYHFSSHCIVYLVDLFGTVIEQQYTPQLWAYSNANIGLKKIALFVICNVSKRVHCPISFSKVASTLHNHNEKGCFDGRLVSDNEYPRLPFMMTSYLYPKPGAESCFNEALYEKKACIKTTFTTLRARFSCLKGLQSV